MGVSSRNMGLRENMRVINRLGRPDAQIPGETSARGSRSALPSNPFQTGSLTQLPYADIFGLVDLMNREQAMTIPGVARGRGILISLIADKPILAYAQNGADPSTPSIPLPKQPAWLYRTPGWQGPYQRMLLTLDDHIFHGESLWGVERGAAAVGLRPILNAWHIPYDLWAVDVAGRITVANEDGHQMPVDESEVIYLPSSSEGLLSYASRTLRGAVELERAWTARAKNPIPALDLHETEETNLTIEERQQIVDMWAAARGDVNGAVASTPFNIEARVLGTVDSALMIEGRNAIKLDLANFFQLPAALLDATTAAASLTYSTQESALSSVDAMTIPYWVRPLEDRLGQDDVVPIGQTVRFAFGYAYTEGPGPIATNGTIAPVTDPAAETDAGVGAVLPEVTP